MKPHFELPQALTTNLADSDLEVVSWSAQTQELVLEVVKDVSSERGLVRFLGVSYVSLAPRFTLGGIMVSNGDGEAVFLIQDPWGGEHRVFAESLTYTVTA
jgi:hypothetical protein